jgi:hypothetical protein
MATERYLRPASRSLTSLGCALIFSVMLMAGCGAGAGSGNSGNSIAVSITNKVSSVQAGTAAIVFTATVQNDSSNSGVNWSLSAGGLSCSPACGTLSQATATTVTYAPPASAPATLSNQPTVTATSVAKTNKSDSDAFTITAAVTVTITNKFSSVNLGYNAFVVNATVQNDSTNSGVAWTLTANGAPCAQGSAQNSCGTLSAATKTSVTYTPPKSNVISPAGQATLTAISVQNGSKSDSDSFTISNPAVAVSITNKISTVPASSGMIIFFANVQNDSSGAATTWTLTANGTNCQPACGTLATGGPQNVPYTPPASVPSAPNNSPTLTAISGVDSSKTDTDRFTIGPAVPILVTINQVSSVLAGTSGVTFDANVQNDSTNSGVNWSLTAGGVSCSPACGTLSTPSGSNNTTVYMPPASVPAAPDNTARITATSVADNTKSGLDDFTITSTVANSCSGAPSGHESLLNGHYAMVIQGFEGGGGGNPILIGAGFTANGSGGITGGEEDTNDTISAQNLAFDSTPGRSLYTVGADHRGCLQLTTSAGTTTTFRFALSGINSNVASKGRIIEFDDGSGVGSRGSGVLRLQDASSFVLSALQGQYAFGVDGWVTNGNQFAHLGVVGAFTIDGSGDLRNGVDDTNINGLLSLDANTPPLEGTIQPISASTGRATGAFDVFNWAIYVINPSEFFVVGMDTTETSAGRVLATGNSFTASSLSGNYIVHSSGSTGGKANVGLQLLTMTPGGGQTGTLSGTAYSDGGGSGLQTTTLSSVSYNVDPASGRVVLGNPGDNLPIFYLTTPTDGISGFLVGMGADAQMGLVEFQPSQTYSAASAAGSYALSTEDPGDNSVVDDISAAMVASSGSVSGTLDSSGSAGLSSGAPFNATLTIANANGTGTLGAQTLAIINGTKIFYIDETTGSIVVAEQ